MAGDAKIRIKVGSLELDYEGDPEFLNDGLEDLLEKMAGLSDLIPALPAQNLPTAGATNATNAAITNELNYSTKTIAAKMDAKKGPELTICAIAQLELVQGLSGVGRQQILDEMKSAKGYYNKNMSSNLSKILNTLIKNNRICEDKADTYSLSAKEKTSLEAKIAEIG